jgi:hypothetical protein
MTCSFKSQYHPYCPIDWNNLTSIQYCWLGDTTVPLPDVNTQDPTVVSTYGSWISNLVQEYGIDGLRIDGTFVPFLLSLSCNENFIVSRKVRQNSIQVLHAPLIIPQTRASILLDFILRECRCVLHGRSIR